MSKNKTKKANRVSNGGIYHRADTNRYVARFTLNGKRVSVGSYVSKAKATQALKAARSQYL